MCPAVCTGQGELGLKVDRRQCFLCHYLYWDGGGQMTTWLLYVAILLFHYPFTINNSYNIYPPYSIIHLFLCQTHIKPSYSRCWYTSRKAWYDNSCTSSHNIAITNRNWKRHLNNWFF